MATIAERLAAAEKEALAAEAAVSTPEFEAEEEARRKLAEFDQRTRDAKSRARDADVARRLDAAHARLGDDAKIEAVLLTERADSFVVGGAGSAQYKAWEDGIRDAAMSKMAKGTRHKVNADDVVRRYVAAGIVDWNGLTFGGEDDNTEDGVRLNEFLRANPSIVSELFPVISRLDGAASEARKR